MSSSSTNGGVMVVAGIDMFDGLSEGLMVVRNEKREMSLYKVVDEVWSHGRRSGSML